MKTGWLVGIIAAVIVLAGIIYFAAMASYSPSANMPSTPSNTPSNTPAASGNAVTIENFAFSPATLNVKVGDTVTWTNRDSAPHKIASDSGSELSSDTLSQGGTYSHTFTQAGTYDYHCAIHTSMKGKVIVS